MAIIENWGIVQDGEPFSSRPGAAFPQEVFNLRIRESIKWQKALSTLQPDYRLNAKTALAALPQAEFDKHSQLENKVVIAFAEELTKEEHTRLAKGEAARPQSFYDARVREAFEWLLNHQELRPEDRLRRWESALAEPASRLKAEVRQRYNKQQ